MSGATTDTGTKLAADGCELTLSDGTTVRLKFTMRAVLAVEEALGGVAQLLDAVNMPNTAMPLLSALVTGIRCGLTGQTYTRDVPDFDTAGKTTTRVSGPFTDEVLLDLLDPGRIKEYVRVVGAALDEAFPVTDPAAAADADGDVDAEGNAPAATDGRPGITTPRSPSVAPTKISGA